MSELSSIYPSTINRAYYIASFLMRDENLTLDVLKESYSQVGQYAEMLKEGTEAQALVDRIVSAQALEDLRLKDNVSYQAFYKTEGEDHSFYIDRDKLEPFVPKSDTESIEPRGVSSYDKAAGRFVTTLRLQPQPQSDAAFLYYYVGMSVKEIAAAMDVSEDVVQGHLHSSNVKLMADAENWMKQGRIPAGIDTIPFLMWSLKRDAQRNPYRGVNLLKVLNQKTVSDNTEERDSFAGKESDAERRAEQELAGDIRSTGLRRAVSGEVSTDGSDTSADDYEFSKIRNPGASQNSLRHTGIAERESDEAYEEDESHRVRIPVIPVFVGILILAVVLVVFAGLHHRSTVAERSSYESTTASDSSEKKEKTASASNSSTNISSSSSSESTKYEDAKDDPDGYIFPDSDKKYLTESDLQGMDKEHLRLGRNELYARHGVTFGMQDLQDYFQTKSWYHPKVSINDFDSSTFNKYENANLKLILKAEQQVQ